MSTWMTFRVLAFCRLMRLLRCRRRRLTPPRRHSNAQLPPPQRRVNPHRRRPALTKTLRKLVSRRLLRPLSSGAPRLRSRCRTIARCFRLVTRNTTLRKCLTTWSSRKSSPLRIKILSTWRRSSRPSSLPAATLKPRPCTPRPPSVSLTTARVRVASVALSNSRLIALTQSPPHLAKAKVKARARMERGVVVAVAHRALRGALALGRSCWRRRALVPPPRLRHPRQARSGSVTSPLTSPRCTAQRSMAFRPPALRMRSLSSRSWL